MLFRSLIVRITFLDAQEHEISHLEFQQRSLEFVYPASAVQYRVELINNGLTDLKFQRFEICDADLPVSVHEDIWIHTPLNKDKPGKLNLLLIADSKRTRKTMGELEAYGPYRLQPISIAWQSTVNIVETIKSWLINNRELNANIISTVPQLDQVALSLKMEIPSVKTIITDRVIPDSDLADVVYPVVVPSFWSSSVLINPDWPIIFSTIQKINAKEE